MAQHLLHGRFGMFGVHLHGRDLHPRFINTDVECRSFVNKADNQPMRVSLMDLNMYVHWATSAASDASRRCYLEVNTLDGSKCLRKCVRCWLCWDITLYQWMMPFFGASL